MFVCLTTIDLSSPDLFQLITHDGDHEFPLSSLVAGSMAGTTSVLFTYPLDVVRTRMAFQVIGPRRYAGVLDALGTMYSKEGGMRSLYKGFGPTVLGIIPYAGVSFFTYGQMKLFFERRLGPSSRNSEGHLSIPIRLLCGMVAGVVAQTASYPLDIVRRRMQAEGLSEHVPIYRHTIDGFRRILATQGFRGLFLGLSVNYLKVAPAVSISFVSFEIIRKQLDMIKICGSWIECATKETAVKSEKETKNGK